ncbi:protein of unknown function [Streptomyces sp. KY75]|nr:protein of unknown function [Streptomyces sp. KY75]CAD5973909.1 protein of unknown function [Streptomyces sp. KY70]
MRLRDLCARGKLPKVSYIETGGAGTHRCLPLLLGYCCTGLPLRELLSGPY